MDLGSKYVLGSGVYFGSGYGLGECGWFWEWGGVDVGSGV